jgi:hypothetical protein
MADNALKMLVDGAAAASNIILVISIVWGGLLALRRWNVAFALRDMSAPMYGESSIGSGPPVKSKSWNCRLELADGHVAHVKNVRLQRRVLGFWSHVKGATAPHVHMPTSMLKGDSFELFLGMVPDEHGPFRLKINEYASIRATYVPFIEPELLPVSWTPS